MPPKLAPLIVAACDGEVGLADLRPDDHHLIWPDTSPNAAPSNAEESGA
ncbi:MAG: hypothetical protein V4792_16450 [Pseudomonadota bacterium]